MQNTSKSQNNELHPSVWCHDTMKPFPFIQAVCSVTSCAVILYLLLFLLCYPVCFLVQPRCRYRPCVQRFIDLWIWRQFCCDDWKLIHSCCAGMLPRLKHFDCCLLWRSVMFYSSSLTQWTLSAALLQWNLVRLSTTLINCRLIFLLMILTHFAVYSFYPHVLVNHVDLMCRFVSVGFSVYSNIWSKSLFNVKQE